ncbi:hypothetical protein [Streptomyces litchfieldiae]|uniref:Uncharacterized protein n=1 Tax=Streptomyces litchfieldiae TaxID=3075543 RepID=A0ABU2N386_9ACTN|nr:hypothetical protein [Streptomyces sp. DSM 44938]MDT0347513.1 hypothetical protein [Streptomyces sp. DSM 44938]
MAMPMVVPTVAKKMSRMRGLRGLRPGAGPAGEGDGQDVPPGDLLSPVVALGNQGDAVNRYRYLPVVWDVGQPGLEIGAVGERGVRA